MAIDVPDFLKLTQLAAPSFLGSVDIPVGDYQATASFDVSPFATGLVAVPLASAGPVFGDIQGGVSGFVYASVTFPVTGAFPLFAPLGGNIDNPVSVSVQSSFYNPGPNPIHGMLVYQLFGASIVVPQNPIVQPLYTQEVPGVGGAVGVPAVQNAVMGLSLAANTSGSVIAATANKTITILGYEVTISASVPATLGAYLGGLQDTTGAVTVARWIDRHSSNIGDTGEIYTRRFRYGLRLAFGAGLNAIALAGNPAAMSFQGSVDFIVQ